MTSPQSFDPDGPNPPQFDSLTKHPASSPSRSAGTTSASPASRATARTRQATRARRARTATCRAATRFGRIQAKAPKVAAVILGIHQRSPRARVIAVNSPRSCPTRDRLLAADADHRRRRAVRAREGEGAERHDRSAGRGERRAAARLYTASIGHDGSKLPVIRGVEPVVPVNAAAPVHPNLGGMIGASELLTAALGRTRAAHLVDGGEPVSKPRRAPRRYSRHTRARSAPPSRTASSRCSSSRAPSGAASPRSRRGSPRRAGSRKPARSSASWMRDRGSGSPSGNT